MAFPDKFVKNVPHYSGLGHLVNTVIHVGAHEAEELLFYVTKLKAKNIMLFEPNPDKFDIIRTAIDYINGNYKVNIIFYPLGLGSGNGKHTLTSFQGRSSGWASLLKPKIKELRSALRQDSREHTAHGGGVDSSPIFYEVFTTTLNAAINRNPEFKDTDLMVVDTQGYELEVLRGSTNVLPRVKSIDLEVTINSASGFYENNPSEKACTKFLNTYGYEPDISVSSFWGQAKHGRLLYRNTYYSVANTRAD